LEWTFTVHKTPVIIRNNQKRNFWKRIYQKINEELSGVNWMDVLAVKSLDNNWKIFSDKMLQMVDRYIPFKADIEKKVTSLSKKTIRQIKERNEKW
jgi:hypothetical protein